MENFLLGLVLLQFGHFDTKRISYNCNHKVCFWKKEEQRIFSASCDDCNKDVAKINCPKCRLPYHVETKTYNVSGLKLSDDFFKIKWIWNLNK